MTGGTSFLSLPPELRNEVYRHHKADLDLDPKTAQSKDVWIHEWKERSDFPYRIVRVNQQIRAEASMMFYKGVNIHFDIPDAEGYANCTEWLEIMHPQALSAAATFEITAAHVDCDCEKACLIKIHVKEDDEAAVAPERTLEIEIKLPDSAKKRTCWTGKKRKTLERGLKRALKHVQPGHGMLKMSKETLGRVLECATGRVT